MANEKQRAAESADDVRLEVLNRQRDFWRFFGWLRQTLQKGLIWGVFFFIFWLLRDFFTLIFMTFVFSFVSTTLARALGRHFPRLGWKTRVVCVFSGFLMGLTLIVWLTIPQIKQGIQQMRGTIEDLPTKWEQDIDPWLYENLGFYRRLVEAESVRAASESDAAGVENGEAGETGEAGSEAPPKPAEAEPPDGAPGGEEEAPREVDAGDGAGPEEEEPERVTLFQTETFRAFLNDFQQSSLDKIPGFITDAVTAITAVFSLLFLSVLFSFLIVLDLDVLRREVMKLERTKLHGFYKETVLNIVKFGSVLGKVLEAQAVIALVNTVLTAIGLWILDIPNVGFLSLFVFVCGFIPVAGVFISSVPICLIGLYEGGVGMLLILILFITGIHFLEAYVLNPRIMGAALHINPVLVLIILVIGHHGLGVWGLLLGLPICYYFFTHVIKREDREIGLRVKFKKKRPPAAAP